MTPVRDRTIRGFMYCDSGKIPWLPIAAHVSRAKRPLSALVADRRAAYPSSGAINFRLDDTVPAITRVEDTMVPQARAVDRLDGLGCDDGDGRFTLRPSNPEPVLRLTVEARGDRALLAGQVAMRPDVITA